MIPRCRFRPLLACAWLICAAFLLLLPLPTRGDAGILLPRGKAQPDPVVLSLEEMEITIRRDAKIPPVTPQGPEGHAAEQTVA